MALTALAAGGTFLVKGIFIGFLLSGCAIWLFTIRPKDSSIRFGNRRAWIGLAVAAVFTVGVAGGYEYLYRAVTHESFLSPYLSRQIGGSISLGAGNWAVMNKAYDIASYALRLLWFAFPASLVAIAAAWTSRGRSEQGLRFALAVSVLYVVLLGLFNRVADRYLFPAFYVLGACGWIAAVRGWNRFELFAGRLDRYQPFVSPALWLLLIGLNLVGGALGVPLTKLHLL